MTNLRCEDRNWQLFFLVGTHLFVVCFFLTSLLPGVAEFYTFIDEQVYFTLNGTMRWHENWIFFWAIGNSKLFDKLAIVFLLLIFSMWLHRAPNLIYQKILMLIAFVAYVLFWKHFTTFVVDVFSLHRLSPSLVFTEAIMPSEFIGYDKTKDFSDSSYPGDHGFVVLMMTFFFAYYAGIKWAAFTLLMTLPFIIPRLAGGAHWTTDLIFGSMPMALIAIAWWRYTPLNRISMIIGHITNIKFSRP